MRNIILLSSAVFLLSCAHSSPHLKKPPAGNSPQITKYDLATAPKIGQTKSGQAIFLGGFSGLVALGSSPSNPRRSFLTVTDRGPNGKEVFSKTLGYKVRPFLLPEYSPRLVYFELDEKRHELNIAKQVILKGPNGLPLTGLPPARGNGPVAFETATDQDGKILPPDFLGIDSEGVTVDEQNFIWVCDEYRPSLMKFSSEGVLQTMYTPIDFYSRIDLKNIYKKYGSSEFIKQILPKKLMNRKMNRGFEGISVRGGEVVAIMQSPLKNEELGNKLIRWVSLNITAETVTELLYTLDDSKVDKLGDLNFYQNSIYVLEQDSNVGPQSNHQVFRIEDEKLKTTASLSKKNQFFDLVALGINKYEKLEGLAMVSSTQLAIVNDNDFSLAHELDSEINLDPAKTTSLLMISW